MYTDGITEARNNLSELYGMEKFIEEINLNINLNGNDFIKNIVCDLMMFKNSAPINDDSALLIADILRG